MEALFDYYMSDYVIKYIFKFYVNSCSILYLYFSIKDKKEKKYIFIAKFC
jgi:hypothetical protein